MTADQAQQLIRRVGKGFWLSALTKMSVIVAGVGAMFGVWGALTGQAESAIDVYVLMASAVVWVSLSIAGNAGSRLIHAAAAYTSAGQFDMAERVLVTAANGFSLFRGQRLLAMQNLALLAHGAGRFAAAAIMSRFVVTHLARSRRLVRAFDHPNRLMLADSELMLGHLGEAHTQLATLESTELNLSEQLALAATSSYYEVAAGQWQQLAAQAQHRARLAALMPPVQAAATLACSALGCQNTGRPDQCDWLWKEATLLINGDDLLERLPLLTPLRDMAAIRLPWPDGATDCGESE